MHILVGGLMMLCQRHQYVRIARAYRRRRAVGQVNAAVGQPDVVDDARHLVGWYLLTNGLLHQIAQARRFFDPRTRPGPKVQFELTAIHSREKILPKPGNQDD